MKKNVTVIGAGYVGMSTAVMLSQKNNVKVFDINNKKLDLINSKISPVNENFISKFLSDKKLSIAGVNSFDKSIVDADFIFLALPTDYDEKKKSFDTNILESVIKDAININKSSIIIIKSTVPVGFTRLQSKLNETSQLVFSPEFLREGSSLEDSVSPSRVIFGCKSNTNFNKLSKLIKTCTSGNPYKTLHMSSCDAEAVKLFSNSYLALRVSFFNELDNYSIFKNLDTKNIIDGMSLDSRIGNYYNNPSFGFGGYCLPKDTKQLNQSYENIPNSIIASINKSNQERSEFIANEINNLCNGNYIGIFRLLMKQNSDNYRSSSIISIIKYLLKMDKKVIVFEPLLDKNEINLEVEITNDLEDFKKRADLIVTNRNSHYLKDVISKVYSRDIYNKDTWLFLKALIKVNHI